MSHRPFTVPGFRFSGISAGIKTGRLLDLALIVSDVPAVAAGVFTTNRVQAAPVLVSKKNIRSGRCRAVVVNSGNANACSGSRGLRDAAAMVRTTAQSLSVPEREVLVCSTGKIGLPLPISKILKKIPEAVDQLSSSGLLKSARAILTTDDSVKIASAQGQIGGKGYRLTGFAKGAGMIEPHLATMLAFFLTDAQVGPAVLRTVFDRCVSKTFNRITVDGDTSTNDTALILANGLAGNHPLEPDSESCRQFEKNLLHVMDRLARMMVADGEGATKCVTIEVRGAKNDADARKIAYAVGNSLLVKTSFFGEDPNWGRILGAAGRSGAALKSDCTDIFYDRVCVARRGVSTGPLRDREAKRVMKRRNFTVTIDGHAGKGTFRIYASDLSLDYVKLNSCYRT